MTDKASKTTYLSTKTSNMIKKSKNRQKTVENTSTRTYLLTKHVIRKYKLKCVQKLQKESENDIKSSVMNEKHDDKKDKHGKKMTKSLN